MVIIMSMELIKLLTDLKQILEIMLTRRYQPDDGCLLLLLMCTSQTYTQISVKNMMASKTTLSVLHVIKDTVKLSTS